MTLIVTAKLISTDCRILRLCKLTRVASWRRQIYSITGTWNKELNINTKLAIEDYWRPKLEALQNELQKNDRAEKTYVLSMFPYPSGRLHLGHIRLYCVSDAIARFHRLQNKFVIHPIGWDAFGLPAENAAIERGEFPDIWTYNNIEYMKKQLKYLSCSFDWNRELATCDPAYYQWTQFIFLKLYEAGLAYQKEALVNWDPIDKTVLADEQVDEEGCSWRSGAKVEKRYKKQWFFKTTAFAEDLWKGLYDPSLKDWDEVRKIQQHWIGECTGSCFEFELKLNNEILKERLSVWTENPELIFGASFLSLSVDHPLSHQFSKEDKKEPINSEMLLDVHAIHPFTKRKIPIVINENVSYPKGSNCCLGIPAHNSYDLAIAKKFNFQIIEVIQNLGSCNKLINSEQFSGLNVEAAREQICLHASERQFGGYKVSSKLRDWLISRQRYWGTPIPIIHCPKCGTIPVQACDLPVSLPKIAEPVITGQSPLLNSKQWLNVPCPNCGTTSQRETDTMDTFVDSSWYFLRYLDPQNLESLISAKISKQFMPVDIYIGGKEHAALHLFYARFLSHFLHSQGLIFHPEPFQQLLMVGMVKGKTRKVTKTGRYLKEDEVEIKGKKHFQKDTGLPVSVEWEKMSKSKYNGTDPEEIYKDFGVDTTRLFILRGNSPLAEFNFEIRSDILYGVLNWQKRLWFLIWEFQQLKSSDSLDKLTDLDKYNNDLANSKNLNVAQVTFNFSHDFVISGALACLQSLTNSLRKVPREIVGASANYEQALGDLLVMLFPAAPHFISELWTGFVNSPNISLKWPKYVWDQPWPVVDMQYKLSLVCIVNDNVEGLIKIPYQLMDKLVQDDALKLLEQQFGQTLMNQRIIDVNYIYYPKCKAVIRIKTQKEDIKQFSR